MQENDQIITFLTRKGITSPKLQLLLAIYRDLALVDVSDEYIPASQLASLSSTHSSRCDSPLGFQFVPLCGPPAPRSSRLPAPPAPTTETTRKHRGGLCARTRNQGGQSLKLVP